MSKRATLETTVRRLMADSPIAPDAECNVVAFAMERDDCGWSVNEPFRIASRVPAADVPDIIRDRWEVIAANYGRRRVAGLADIGDGPRVSLEADGFPVADIFPAD